MALEYPVEAAEKLFRIAEIQPFPKQTNADLTVKNLSVFLEIAPIGAIVFDQKRKIISANFKAKQLFSPQLDNPAQVSWNDLFFGELPPLSVLLPADSQEQVHEVIKVNNQFLEINISPVNVSEGQPHYSVVIE